MVLFLNTETGDLQGEASWVRGTLKHEDRCDHTGIQTGQGAVYPA